MASAAHALPEVDAVYWRPRMDVRRLRRRGWAWTATTAAHSVPFCATAALLLWLEPLSVPVALIAIAHAWAIPELYAKRGANVLSPPRAWPPRERAPEPERVAAGLVGDLVSHEVALDHYGVVIGGNVVDVAATEAERARLRDRRVPIEPFDFGHAPTGGSA